MPKDIEENSHWYCPKCKASGKCVKGDEAEALEVHDDLLHSGD